MIRFNKPFLTGREKEYIHLAISAGRLSGDGEFSKKCQDFFFSKYNFKNNLLTTSCTDALEMAAILLNINQGDEVIIPSFTFVSTANAFVLRGAKIVFADSSEVNPNIDPTVIESLITPRTKALVVVHYAGVACDIDVISKLCNRYGIHLIEDSAHSINSFYNNKPLGSFGTFSTFSFHETKNISSGEGGLLVINDESYYHRAEIIREKGTNRSAFFRGEIDKYGWVDVGSSFLPSELNAAFLLAQLQALDEIQELRIKLWNNYFAQLEHLSRLGLITIPTIPKYATNNAHMFYFTCKDQEVFRSLLFYLNSKEIKATFHYQPLHSSSFSINNNFIGNCPNATRFSNTLIRLPLYPDLTNEEQEIIINSVISFFQP